jgi:hypothetical protein
MGTHGAAAHLRPLKGDLFQTLGMEMFQMELRTHDERNQLCHPGLNLSDGLKNH